MANQKDLDSVYMGTALLHAGLSKARRATVGAVLVTKQGVTLPGWNGTAVGRPNDCEDEVEWEYEILYTNSTPEPIKTGIKFKTKPEVIHAELNCILKAAKEGVSCLGGTVYVTLSPCVPCAAMLVNAGISRLIYKDTYRDTEGLQLLESCGIVTEKYES